MIRFNVTYRETDGNTIDEGFQCQGVRLRDLPNELCGPADEANSSSGRVRWIDWYGSADIRTGARVDHALHIPATVTDASAKRIARLLGARP